MLDNALTKQEYAGEMGVASSRSRDTIPNLKTQKKILSERLQKIDTLLNLLEDNPNLVQILDLSRELM